MSLWILLVVAAVAYGQSTTSCGNPAVDPVITSVTKVRGGEEAKKGSWPWQARVGAKDFLGRTSIFCGGSILDSTHVLTASHCFGTGSLTGQQFFVRLGDHSNQVAEVGQKDYNVKKVYRHESFSMSNYAGPQNDIAVLELSTPITYTDTISPACLPAKDSDVLVGRTCVITGWGSTVNQSTGSVRAAGQPMKQFFPPQPIIVTSNVLKQALQPVMSRNTCKQVWNPLPIRDHMVCTYHDPDEYTPNVHGEPCQGDSGGPLNCLVEGTSTWNVEGVVSFGAGCGQRGPAVFTRVASYIDWIESKL